MHGEKSAFLNGREARRWFRVVFIFKKQGKAKRGQQGDPIKWQPFRHGVIIVLYVVYVVYQHPRLLLMILESLPLLSFLSNNKERNHETDNTRMMENGKLKLQSFYNSCRVCRNFR